MRLGQIHRNTFVNSPAHLDACYRLRDRPRLRLAGQITGVEGYLESAATGLAIALYLALERDGRTPEPLPPTTALGALARHLTESDPRHFQPANINYGLFRRPRGAGRRSASAAPPTPGAPTATSRRGRRATDSPSTRRRSPPGRRAWRWAEAAVRRLIERFLEHLAEERNFSPHTLRAYRRDLERFAAFLPATSWRQAPDAVDRPPSTCWQCAPSSPPCTTTGWAARARGGPCRRCAACSPSAAARGCWRPTRRPRRARRRRRPAPCPATCARARSRRCSRPPRRRAATRATRRWWPATAPSSSCSTPPACGSASWCRSTGATSTSRRASCGWWARGARSAWCPSAARGGGPARLAGRVGGGAPSAATRGAATAEPVFLNHRGGRLSDRSVRRVLDRWVEVAAARRRRPPPHPAPHLRHPPARGRRRPARHPGAARATASLATTQRYTHVEIERLLAVYRDAHPARPQRLSGPASGPAPAVGPARCYNPPP